MALRSGDVPGENRPGSVPIATARGYGGTEPNFDDADKRYNHPSAVSNPLITTINVKKTSQFIPRCKGDISHAFKTAKITVFDPMMCKSPDVSLQDELLC